MDITQIICDVVLAVMALASVIISIIAICKSGRKFELTHAERESLMKWYSETMDCLMALKIRISLEEPFDKASYLSKLSSLIEQGRFFFPNELEGTGAGKPSAYRGMRDQALDALVFFFQICENEDAKARIKYLDNLERKFTSRVFDKLNPREYNKQMGKNTFLGLGSENKATLDKFLQSDPSNDEFWLD
jgi:hypothetical protein